jgi:hypothetical protein
LSRCSTTRCNIKLRCPHYRQMTIDSSSSYNHTFSRNFLTTLLLTFQHRLKSFLRSSSSKCKTMTFWLHLLYAALNLTLLTIQVTCRQEPASLVMSHHHLKSPLSLVAEMKMKKRKQNLQMSNQQLPATLLCRLSTFKMKIMKNLREKPLK